MAEKKQPSKAEKKVQETKKKPSGTSSKPAKKPAPAKKNPKVKTEYENPISTNFIVAFLSIALFFLFVRLLQQL